MSFLPSIGSLIKRVSGNEPTNGSASKADETIVTPTDSISPSSSEPVTPLQDDPAYDPSLTSPSAVHLASTMTATREISVIESGFKGVGVAFTPSLQEQRIGWCLDVLRRESVSSVLDIGCGEGDLLGRLVRPATTVLEEPVRPLSRTRPDSAVNGSVHGLKRHRSSHDVQDEDNDEEMEKEVCAPRSRRTDRRDEIEEPDRKAILRELFIQVRKETRLI